MSKLKAVKSTIRLVINAGQAKPSPPVGPALGQAGLKIMDFCKDFNGKTADIKVRIELRICIIETAGAMPAGHSSVPPPLLSHRPPPAAALPATPPHRMTSLSLWSSPPMKTRPLTM